MNPQKSSQVQGWAAMITNLTALGRGWKRVPAWWRLPPTMLGMASVWEEEEQMRHEQAAAVAIRAAVSLVVMPPVPHCNSPLVLVSTCTTQPCALCRALVLYVLALAFFSVSVLL